ncbi:hypothetical protein [Streptosporangium sp. NBC_01756]|uniref:hypothetical protein n=1 Tax=Streptosporangium sp. NBC_01756 TaxID=2975950 RepID=UPI002DD95581|nr:hypothetical protein [Streptosporangium sp. NBC_01756]WSC88614.1 hypothetical protein OIE48_10630 [Streptosporangium sp. NBC_01756]
METPNRTTAAAGHVNHPHTQQAFGRVKKLVAAYGALSVAVLIVVVILSVMGREVTSFMWGRTGGMFASAVVTYWLTVLASRGARGAYVRVRIISVIVPIAIIAIDSIPGALPPWFVAMQIAGALTLVPAAFIVNRSELRAAFPKSR